MSYTGGCYCGSIRYVAGGEPLMRGQCHCRECQYISGGSPNLVMGFRTDEFSYTLGDVKVHEKRGKELLAHREFCPECGTHILTRPEGLDTMVVLKVGTLDDPSVFGEAQFALQLADAQSFHHVPENAARYDRWIE